MPDLFDIERLNKRISMELLLKKLKIQLPRSKFLHCPAHKDTHPSLMVWGKEGQKHGWCCFQCGKRGRAVEFLSLWKGITLSQAATRLSKLLKKRSLEIQRPNYKRFITETYYGWESFVCTKVHQAIQSAPEPLRSTIYGAWLNFVEPYFDSVRFHFVQASGSDAVLEQAKQEVSAFLIFITDLWEEEYVEG